MTAERKQEFRNRPGAYVLGENGETTKESVYEVLKEHDLLIMTSESITGDMIVSKPVDVSGVSDYLKRSSMAYSSGTKIGLLGIKAETIDVYGIIGENAVFEMVERMFEELNVGYVIPITGFVSGENAGSVYVGLGYKNMTKMLKLQFHGEYNKIRNRVLNRALAELKLMALEDISCETL